jgi:hypothetical protein
MYIQLLGTPGAGKSFIAPTIAQNYQATVVTPPLKLFKIWYAVLFIVSRPLTAWRVIRLLIRENISNTTLLFHKIKLLIKTFSLEAKGGRVQRRVVDGGLCQLLISLFERKIPDTLSSTILKIIPKNAIIIIVETSPNVWKERMNQRKRIPRYFMGEKYVRNISPVWEYNVRALKEIFAREYEVKVFKN